MLLLSAEESQGFGMIFTNQKWPVLITPASQKTWLCCLSLTIGEVCQPMQMNTVHLLLPS